VAEEPQKTKQMKRAFVVVSGGSATGPWLFDAASEAQLRCGLL
jgi:hypothetical protein